MPPTGEDARLETAQSLRPATRSQRPGRRTGVDSTGSLQIEADASGWVTAVEVLAFADELRTPPGLEGAVREALLSGALAAAVEEVREGRLTPEQIERARALEEGRLRMVDLVPPRPAISLPTVAQLRDRARHRTSAPTVQDERIDRRFTGVSKEREITVRCSWVGGLESLAVDAEWLAATDKTMLRYALKEAFDDVYRKGEQAS